MGVQGRKRGGGRNATGTSPLARKIFELREARGLSQRALAALLGTDQSFVSHVETDRIVQPSIDYLRSFAEALEVPVLALLVDAEYLRPEETVGLDNAEVAPVIVAMREDPAFMAQVRRLGDGDGRVLSRLVSGWAAQLAAIIDDREARPAG